MRIIVTGAEGFAGRWLVEMLATQHTVLPWSRARVDITDAAGCAAALAEDRPDALLHLAALTHPGDAARDPARAHAVNVTGTRNVLAPLPAAVPALVVSTCHVYGPPQQLPIDEHHPLAPRGAYAITKREAERIALDVHPRTVIARAFHHTGPGQSPRYALADWAAQIHADPTAAITAGDVDVRRDYSDVRDIVAGYWLLLSRGTPGRAYNLCSGQSPTLRQLIGAMPDRPVLTDPARLRAADVPDIRGDPTAAEALGWRRSHVLTDTLRAMASGSDGPAPPAGSPSPHGPPR